MKLNGSSIKVEIKEVVVHVRWLEMFGRRAGITKSDVVEGEPKIVGEKEIVPVAEITSFSRGWGKGENEAGWLFVRINPIAVVEGTADGRSRRIPVRDVNKEMMRTFYAVGLFILLFWLLSKTSYFRRWRK